MSITGPSAPRTTRMWRPPGATWIRPAATGSPCSPSRTGRPLMRVKCSARTAVKVAGMCWAIRTGMRSMVGPIEPIRAVSACGPPVEHPISKARGSATANGRSVNAG